MMNQAVSYTMTTYDRRPPFSSFLPGVAGVHGVPMWVFYVNRGQAIASFGVVNKDRAMLEFQPANKAYRLTPLVGFRTFLKLHNGEQTRCYEPFAPWSRGAEARTMHIGLNSLRLEEHHPALGLRIRVDYTTLTNLPLAGLVRRITLHNTGNRPLTIEWLDGLPQVVPFGADNGALKFISRTIEAWMQVEDHADGVPFYRLRASAEDVAEVREIVAGHFALATRFDADGAHPLPVLVDPERVFAWDDTLQQPIAFWEQPLDTLLASEQATVGKTPAALFATHCTLPPGEQTTLVAVFGHSDDRQALAGFVPQLRDAAFLDAQARAAHDLGDALTAPIATQSGDDRFDGYVRQTFLDNLLRGGWPLVLPGGHVYHVYSRKHGDLERDYNDFVVAAEYYSQGNGNFRDVAQNRRMDVWFEPRVDDFNLRLFLSLIQTDGYNPLVIQGLTFRLAEDAIERLLAHTTAPDALRPLLAEPFTPGRLLRALELHAVPLDMPPHDFMLLAVSQAEAQTQAAFGEGFWVDHWTYLLDLVESFAAIYPDRLTETLFAREVPFYNSPALVRPRRDRYVLTEKGVRQYHAVAHNDAEKARLLAEHGPWVRTQQGRGDLFTLRVVEKLLLLALLKFNSRDPLGMGVEMEAGKPGWYDALNGLPGLLGSSMPETYELLRLVRFLQNALTETDADLRLPEEADALLTATLAALDTPPDAGLARWDACNTARETYRERTRLGVSGRLVARSAAEWRAILDRWATDLEAGIARAQQWGGDLPVTYFAWDVTDYDVQTDADGAPRRDEQGRPYVWPRAMRPQPLPPFLEGAVRAMKVLAPDDARALHTRMLDGPLWDAPLGMFKVNASLQNESYEIGRARAFPPGWLENESIWLHMHYKYLLELLKQGLYAEFFAIARTGLIPFRDPAQYGRSPFENSSFLVSTAHPDRTLHGRGFVARLSGATAEFLHMWALMTAGPQPFVMTDAGLTLRLRPALPGWLFTDDGRFEFTFLGRIPVVLHNPARRDLFPGVPRRIVLHPRVQEGTDTARPIVIEAEDVPPPWAERVRQGEIARIECAF